MQKKKDLPQNTPSAWQDSLKKDEQKQKFKKIGIWAGIFVVTILFLAGLVKLAQTTAPSTEPVVNANLPKVNEKDIVVGDPKAKVTITEYSDFQCPSCASANPMINQLLEEYKGKVKLVYRHFPLSQHKNAKIAGQAGYAAWKMDKFSEMKDLLFEKQTEWEALADPSGVFESYAASLGLNAEEFKTIMNSDEAKNSINAGEKEALGLGLSSTPSFFIGNRLVGNAGIDDFRALIEEELNPQK